MTNNPTIECVCQTCKGSGKEYDGAAHTCTACNGVGWVPENDYQEAKPAAYLVTDVHGQKKALRVGAEGIERHRYSGSTLVPLFDLKSLVIELPDASQFDGHQAAMAIQECREAIEAAGIKVKP